MNLLLYSRTQGLNRLLEAINPAFGQHLAFPAPEGFGQRARWKRRYQPYPTNSSDYEGYTNLEAYPSQLVGEGNGASAPPATST